MGKKAERRAEARRLQIEAVAEVIGSLGYDTDTAAMLEVARDLVDQLADIRRSVKRPPAEAVDVLLTLPDFSVPRMGTSSWTTTTTGAPPVLVDPTIVVDAAVVFREMSDSLRERLRRAAMHGAVTCGHPTPYSMAGGVCGEPIQPIGGAWRHTSKLAFGHEARP